MQNLTSIDDLEENRLSYEQNFENTSENAIEQHKEEILDDLPDKDRELFEMLYVEKLSYDDICDQLDITKENLYKRIYRLRQKINEAVYAKIHK